jgi:hypothetical protein
MALATTTIAMIGLGLAAAGTAASYSQARSGAKAQRRAHDLQQRQADIANMRERRAAIRNARVMQASVAAQAANTGLSGSSARDASMANIGSATAGNVSFLDQNAMLSQQAGAENQRAAAYMSRASTYSAIGNIGMGMFNRYGGPQPTAG